MRSDDAPRLISLATAVPPHVLRQDEVTDWVGKVFQRLPGGIERFAAVFGNAGVETRYSCVPFEWYLHRHGWPERARLYLHHSLELLEEAAGTCLARGAIMAEEIDTVISVSSTGVATPSLDAHLVERLGLRADVERLPIFGLGCAGGVLGLARAAALSRACPGSRTLLLVSELCSLTFRPQDMDKSNIVATALFGDGAAAALISTDGDGPAVAGWGEHTWPQSLDVMGWRIEDDGFGVLFSRHIPDLVRHRFRAAVEGFLAKQGLALGDIAGWICHPGGAKVMAAIEAALELDGGVLEHARAVLRDYGNMSAPSVLFVLKRALDAGISGRQLLTALGPGFSAGFALMEV